MCDLLCIYCIASIEVLVHMLWNNLLKSSCYFWRSVAGIGYQDPLLGTDDDVSGDGCRGRWLLPRRLIVVGGWPLVIWLVTSWILLHVCFAFYSIYFLIPSMLIPLDCNYLLILY
jgi:hypothetical protein